jgi:catechol 2,3-dioxygenase-like lactoylglutathione lyase family enzyme
MCKLTAFGDTNDDSQHVVYLGRNGDVVQFVGRKDGWRAQDLTAFAMAPKALGGLKAWYTPYDKTQHVFYVSKDGQVIELFYNPSQPKWVANNLTQHAKAPPAASSLCGYVDQDHKAQHLFYRGKDGNLVELMIQQSNAGGWTFNDLSKMAQGTPQMVGHPCAYYCSDGNSAHVVFRDKDGAIHELVYTDKSRKWTHNALTDAAKGPKAAADPCAFCRPGENAAHVVFRAQDGALIELRGKEGAPGGWTVNNLTSAAAAPAAEGRPCGCVIGDNKILKNSRMRVLYRGKDSMIHELAWDSDHNKWTHNNLSEQAKAPKAIGDPFCYGFGNREHVVYEAEGAKIMELFYVPSGDNRGWHMTDLSAAAK